MTSLHAKNQEKEAKKRLEEIRAEIKKESISYGEIAELESLREYINNDDIELLQWIDNQE